MTDDEITTLLNDPFATLVLRRGVFPVTLTDVLAAISSHDGTPEGLPETASYLVSEGGQIRFQPGVNKGGTRLLVARSRNGIAELLISALVPPGVSPRQAGVLIEVIAWDPVNQTFHYYQRERGNWLWCGQSDMALVSPTRGTGPFDSHINGYVVMKELKTPWVHWSKPALEIPSSAYAPDDPLTSDPLFINSDTALDLEKRVIRKLADRWNDARFEKSVENGTLTHFDQYARQILTATAANLVSTHKKWSDIDSGGDLDDLPHTFFFDADSLVDALGFPVTLAPLTIGRDAYRTLAEKYDLRVRGLDVDFPGDLPFCFTVPERALEDVLALTILLKNNVISRRLAASLLMVDFPNPFGSPSRAALLKYMPDEASVGGSEELDRIVAERITAAADNTAQGSPERSFAQNWSSGPAAWSDVYAGQIESYLTAIADRLRSAEGADDIFRLAESRRREFRRRPLSEFDLSLPQAVAIPQDAAKLSMTADALIKPR